MFIIYTIGYEGTNISEFIETLISQNINHVIDVRDRPISRKPGFSKKSLSAYLKIAGIDYTHIQALGDPKAGREAMKAGDKIGFEKIYYNHLSKEESQASLRELVKIAETASSVLLCFERDPTCCHRLVIANEVSKFANSTICHLEVAVASYGGKHVREAGVGAIR